MEASEGPPLIEVLASGWIASGFWCNRTNNIIANASEP
jgi:hypothetical protein